jgi:hypothetical protein
MSSIVKLYKTVSLLCVVTILIVSCFGPRQTVRRNLFFERWAERDTTDFYHARLDNRPISIEVLGKSDAYTDSTYVLSFQIGVYGSPAYQELNLILNPDSIKITAEGVRPITDHSIVINPYGGNPWEALSVHWFVFDINALQRQSIDSPALRLVLNLDGYAVYENQPAIVERIVVLDPWFCREMDSNRDN